MHFIHLSAVLTFFSSINAFPIDSNSTVLPVLTKRIGRGDGSSYHDAMDVRLDAKGWEYAANADAWAKLCGGADRILQSLPGDTATVEHDRQAHYRASGAKLTPFKTAELMEKYGLTRPPTPDGSDPFLSAEEYPFEGCNVLNEGERSVFLIPVPSSNQKSQGGYLSGLFKNVIGRGTWFHIVAYDNCHLTYCEAFNRDDPSVCFKKLKGKEIDPGDYAYKKVSKKYARTVFQKFFPDSGI